MNQSTNEILTSSGGEKSKPARKLSLPDWAAIAEIVSSVVVVVSLIAVIYSLERNTAALNVDNFNRIFEGMREIEMAVATNPEYADLVYRGKQDPSALNEVERHRYKLFLTGYFDLWEQMWDRRQEGVMDESIASDWDNYWGALMKRYLSQAVWAELAWQYNESFVRHVEAQVGLVPLSAEQLNQRQP